MEKTHRIYYSRRRVSVHSRRTWRSGAGLSNRGSGNNCCQPLEGPRTRNSIADASILQEPLPENMYKLEALRDVQF